MPQPYLENGRDQTADLWLLRYDEACHAFNNAEISTDVFKAKLYGLGFRGAELETEINLNYPTG